MGLLHAFIEILRREVREAEEANRNKQEKTVQEQNERNDAIYRS